MRFATFPSWNCPCSCWVLFVTFQYISATFLFACYFSHVGAEPFMFKLFKACTGWNQTFCILFARLWRWNPIVFFFESRDSSHPLCFGWQQIQNPWQRAQNPKPKVYQSRWEVAGWIRRCWGIPRVQIPVNTVVRGASRSNLRIF